MKNDVKFYLKQNPNLDITEEISQSEMKTKVVYGDLK